MVISLAFSEVPRTYDIANMRTIRALVTSEFLELLMPTNPKRLTFGLTQYLNECVVPFRLEMGWEGNSFDVNLPIDVNSLRPVLDTMVSSSALFNV